MATLLTGLTDLASSALGVITTTVTTVTTAGNELLMIPFLLAIITFGIGIFKMLVRR